MYVCGLCEQKCVIDIFESYPCVQGCKEIVFNESNHCNNHLANLTMYKNYFDIVLTRDHTDAMFTNYSLFVKNHS